MLNVRFLFFVLLLSAVFFVGLGMGYYLHELPSFNEHKERRLGEVGLVNPLLDCSETAGVSFSGSLGLNQLHEKLKLFQAQQSFSSSHESISIYLRDLNNGPWLGVNEGQTLSFGSLLKVPLAVGFFKRSEEEAGFLENKTIFADKNLETYYDVQGVVPSERLQLNQSYTLKELIERALVYSDNVAAVLLERYDQHQSLIKTARDLDIPIRKGVPPLRDLTIKEYAAILRILYNVSYLNRHNSEEILKLLAQSKFKSGLVAGVAEGTVVAHKFGESLDVTGKTKYFHDCGIVYLPKRPYLLCVATIGKETDKTDTMIGWIQKISEIVYEEMSTQP